MRTSVACLLLATGTMVAGPAFAANLGHEIASSASTGSNCETKYYQTIDYIVKKDASGRWPPMESLALNFGHESVRIQQPKKYFTGAWPKKTMQLKCGCGCGANKSSKSLDSSVTHDNFCKMKCKPKGLKTATMDRKWEVSFQVKPWIQGSLLETGEATTEKLGMLSKMKDRARSGLRSVQQLSRTLESKAINVIRHDINPIQSVKCGRSKGYVVVSGYKYPFDVGTGCSAGNSNNATGTHTPAPNREGHATGAHTPAPNTHSPAPNTHSPAPNRRGRRQRRKRRGRHLLSAVKRTQMMRSSHTGGC